MYVITYSAGMTSNEIGPFKLDIQAARELDSEIVIYRAHSTGTGGTYQRGQNIVRE